MRRALSKSPAAAGCCLLPPSFFQRPKTLFSSWAPLGLGQQLLVSVAFITSEPKVNMQRTSQRTKHQQQLLKSLNFTTRFGSSSSNNQQEQQQHRQIYKRQTNTQHQRSSSLSSSSSSLNFCVWAFKCQLITIFMNRRNSWQHGIASLCFSSRLASRLQWTLHATSNMQHEAIPLNRSAHPLLAASQSSFENT